jgi:hypothetical protein
MAAWRPGPAHAWQQAGPGLIEEGDAGFASAGGLLDPGPVLGDPAGDGVFVALQGAAEGALHAPAQPLVEHRPQVPRVVAHPGQPLDQLPDARQGPQLAGEPVGAGALQQGLLDPPEVGVAEPRLHLKGHAGDLLKVDRRGRPPEYVERPCLTIGLAVQPEVLRGLASRPGFGGRGLLARFLYSLPASLVGRRQVGAPSVPAAVASRYTLELQALAASLTTAPGPTNEEAPAVLVLDQEAAELLLAFERDLEPRLAAGSGDLAHLAGWAAKLAGATCRLAGLLHLAGHLRDGWAQPIAADTFAAAIRLADYLVEHARAVFDLMGADPRVDDARWLLDWVNRTNRTQFSRRDAHAAAPRGRFPKAVDLEPALRLLEEHGYLRRVDPEPPRDPRGRGRPASPRFLVNPSPRATETTQTTKTSAGAVSVDSVVSVARGDTPGSSR